VQVIALSLTHLGLGTLALLALAGVREVGRGFFTLCGWSGVALAAAGYALTRVPTGQITDISQAAAGAPQAWVLASLSALSFAFGWVFLRARRRGAAGPLIRLSGLLAVAALAAQGWFFAASVRPGASAGLCALSAADFVLSAGVLGGVTVAMVLGHWYLVQPGLAIEPLARLSGAFIVLLVARIALEAWAVTGAVGSGWLSLTPPPGEVLPFPVLVLSQRALFGVLGPIILAPLVWKTVSMRSTMSATGLLYVAVALVWVGEFLSKYLLLPLRGMGAA